MKCSVCAREGKEREGYYPTDLADLGLVCFDHRVIDLREAVMRPPPNRDALRARLADARKG